VAIYGDAITYKEASSADHDTNPSKLEKQKKLIKLTSNRKFATIILFWIEVSSKREGHGACLLWTVEIEQVVAGYQHIFF
jgi:hypothetical protein